MPIVIRRLKNAEYAVRTLLDIGKHAFFEGFVIFELLKDERKALSLCDSHFFPISNGKMVIPFCKKRRGFSLLGKFA